MIVLRVLDTELYEKTVRLGNTLVKGVSVYPFFRETGEVEYLMVVLPGETRVFMLPYTKGMIHVHLWGAVSVDATLHQLKVLGDLQAKQLEGLFHYDTRGLLFERRFAEYWAGDMIRQTNCAKTLMDQINQEFIRLKFKRDVSKLEYVEFGAKGLKASTILAADVVLKSLTGSAPKGPGFREETGNGQWVLDPVWQNWGKPGPIEWR